MDTTSRPNSFSPPCFTRKRESEREETRAWEKFNLPRNMLKELMGKLLILKWCSEDSFSFTSSFFFRLVSRYSASRWSAAVLNGNERKKHSAWCKIGFYAKLSDLIISFFDWCATWGLQTVEYVEMNFYVNKSLAEWSTIRWRALMLTNKIKDLTKSSFIKITFC